MHVGSKVDYDLSGRHLVVKLEGDYTIEALLQALDSGLSALDPPARAFVLIDARAATGTRPSSAIRELGMSVSQMGDRIERIAIAVSTDVHFGLARMASMFAGDVGASSDVFRDIAEARAFLELPPEE